MTCSLYMECLENAAACIKIAQEQRNVFIKQGSKAVHVERVSTEKNASSTCSTTE